MANIKPNVWMPWDGTIQTASSERIRILPRRPRNLASGVSATVTPRLTNDCLEMLNAQKELFTRLPSFRSIEVRTLTVAKAPHAEEPHCLTAATPRAHELGECPDTFSKIERHK